MANDTVCHHSCSGEHGICMHGTCQCFQGYWGDLCEKKLDDYYPTTWLVIRLIIGIIYALICFLGILILFKFIRKGDLHKPKNKIALHVVGSFVIYYLLTAVMYFGDPFGGDVYPLGFTSVYIAFSVFMGCYSLGAILNYWIQIFHFTKTRLEREQKLMKINSNYNPQVTIEDIENSLKRINRWKIPYVFCVSLITVLQIITIIVTVTLSPAYLLVELVNLVVLLIVYLAFTIAFFVYERKILSLLDKRETQEVKSIRSISRRVRFFSAVSVGTVIVSALYSFFLTTPEEVIVFKILASLEQFICTNVIYSIYLDYRPSEFKNSVRSLFSDQSESSNSQSLNMSSTTLGNGQTEDDAEPDVETVAV